MRVGDEPIYNLHSHFRTGLSLSAARADNRSPNASGSSSPLSPKERSEVIWLHQLSEQAFCSEIVRTGDFGLELLGSGERTSRI